MIATYHKGLTAQWLGGFEPHRDCCIVQNILNTLFDINYEGNGYQFFIASGLTA